MVRRNAVRKPRVRAVALAAGEQMVSGFAQRNDLVLLVARGSSGAERRPLLHQTAPLLEHVASAVAKFF
jgi:hypothetical protein